MFALRLHNHTLHRVGSRAQLDELAVFEISFFIHLSSPDRQFGVFVLIKINVL